MMDSLKEKQSISRKNSDDILDAIAALILIAVVVIGLVFWLSDMPY
jgi:hypothetical protein